MAKSKPGAQSLGYLLLRSAWGYRSDVYTTILQRLRHGDTFLEVGCFLGQDMRRLVNDGAPSESLHAVDIVNFWELGYEMFRDKKRFKANFIEADLLDPSPALKALSGKIDVIYTSLVLHQWEWDKQVEAAKRLVDLSRPGTILFGFQLGSLTSEVTPVPNQDHGYLRHDIGTWKDMWDQVGEETGSKWEAITTLKTLKELGRDPEVFTYLGEDARMMDFSATRQEM